jgi:hypothetical protein
MRIPRGMDNCPSHLFPKRFTASNMHIELS